ncbi:hypothetical protein TRVL_09169 [Trypanosoma vivax]|uniref:C3H1-type domain-containing protein n=1 Tax=Trypanosoma vivax (strain Y486) TaxID=1055687 RepID=G0UC92_TRYVY|nr:hypothetical protein TRVL_09169 [Trypanosoma vivax]CCC53442.1 conserved hypothetical protein [Trypanosoma vivax Y486]
MGAKKPVDAELHKDNSSLPTKRGTGEGVYTHNPYNGSRSNKEAGDRKSFNLCRHYAEGRCNRGSACRFYHEIRHNIIVTPHSTPKWTSIASLTGIPVPPPGSSLASPCSKMSAPPLSPIANQISEKSSSFNQSVSSPVLALDMSAYPPTLLHLPRCLSTGCNSPCYVAPTVDGAEGVTSEMSLLSPVCLGSFNGYPRRHSIGSPVSPMGNE